MAIKEIGQSADSIIGIEVSQTAPTNTQVLAYNSTSNKWESTAASSGGLTQEEVEDFVNGVCVGGTNVTITYDDAAGSLTFASTDTNTQLTQEQVEDYVNGVCVGGTNVTITYDDAAGTLTFVAADTNTQLTQEQVEDYVNGLIVAGSNVTKTYDDAAGTLTLAATDTDTTGGWTDGTNVITLTTSTDNLGLGFATPPSKLSIYDDLGAPSDLGDHDNYQVVVQGGPDTGETSGILLTTAATTYGGSGIVHYDEGPGGKGDLAFLTKQSEVAEPPVEAMRITSGGNLGVGTDAAKVAVDVHHDPTGLSGDTGGGESVKFGSGTTVAGKMYYLNSSGAWTLTDANAVASGASQLLAIALGTTPGTHGMLIRGFFDVATYLTGTFVQGAAVYVSETTTGNIDVAAPAGSGDFVRVVGHATTTANVIHFNPSGDWIEL